MPVKLSLSDRMDLLRGLFDPNYFKEHVRPKLYKKCDNDAEKVHEGTLDILNKNQWALELISPFFQPPKELMVSLNGKKIAPFGTAAGLDKNGDILTPLSHLLRYRPQEPGTVVVNFRKGNDQPRVAADDKLEDAWNAQGFPSKGLSYFLDKIRDFREARGDKPVVYVSICGLPISEERALEVAMQEMEQLLTTLNPYVNGFVWNPASPNTAALTRLRTPQIFRENAELMRRYAPNKLLLVKIGPYTEETKNQVFSLIDGFMEGGGHGVVGVNTVMFPKEQIPVSNWGYPSGGRSGRFLLAYRMRAVRDMHEAFPNAVIVATGGIYDGDDAYETFKAGATMLEGYTPYTFYGLGLLPRMERRVAQRLRQDGYQSLEQLQLEARRGTKLRV